jgi:hypothetical protein
MLITIGGEGSSIYFLLVPLAICPFWSILSFLGLVSFHLVPFEEDKKERKRLNKLEK